MFKWYLEAQVCYVYLDDVDRAMNDHFQRSRWWSRAWTLQELLAPTDVNFYDKDWTYIGSKVDLRTTISETTGVDVDTLVCPNDLHSKSIAQRMSWASERKASRVEDIAYSLLGIFDINMPLQYGEGKGAFIRLQEKILETTNDQSLFAWGFQPRTLHEVHNTSLYSCWFEDNDSGMFASSPSDFKDSGRLGFDQIYAADISITQLNGALRMDALLIDLPTIEDAAVYRMALLPCSVEGTPLDMVGILLRRWKFECQRYVRVGIKKGTYSAFLVHCNEARKSRLEKIWVDRASRVDQIKGCNTLQSSLQVSVVLELREFQSHGFNFVGVLPSAWKLDLTRSALILTDPKHCQKSMTMEFFSRKKSEVLCILLELSIMRGTQLSAPKLKFCLLPARDETKIEVLEGTTEKPGCIPWNDYGSQTGEHGVTLDTKEVLNNFIIILGLSQATSTYT